MKNISIIVLSLVLLCLVALTVYTQRNYEGLNDEYWLAKTESYLMSVNWLEQIKPDGHSELIVTISQSTEQERQLIELCMLQQCASKSAIRLMISMLDKTQP